MSGNEAFQVEGQVMAVLANGTYRVELANGHRLTAFVAGRARRNFAGMKPGDRVKLQLTPYDLSVGRILDGTKMMETFAPVSLTAASTVLNTGRSRCLLPPLPGVTPPTTSVPYSIICVA